MGDDLIPGPVPGVSESEISNAVKNLVKIPPADLEDHDRFFVAIRSLAESRAQAGWPNEGNEDVSVFLLAPYPRELGQKLGATPVSDLIATSDPILGQLFLLNRDGSAGRRMPLPVKPNEILEWLTDNELDQLPVVTLHRNTKLLISRARGAEGDTRNEVIRDKPPVASLEEVYKALKLSHQEILLTPAACPPGIWEHKRADQYVPGAHPEKAIQRELRTFLTSWFHGVVKAEMEDSTRVGRIDIRLLRPENEGKWAYWVVIELKIIKSFHNAKKKTKPVKVTTSENAEAVAEGVRQASAFGQDRNAQPFLDIYDLRKDKSENILSHATVTDELNKCGLKPECRVWPLYGSASDARIAQTY